MTIHLRPPTFDFAIVGGNGLKIGEVCFDLVEIPNRVKDEPEPWHGPSNPNIPALTYVTRSGNLRASIRRVLDPHGHDSRRIRRAFIGTGTWIHERYAGHGYGREAMRQFLTRWSRVADLVVIRAFPISAGNQSNGPNQDGLVKVWEDVGFVRPSESSYTLYYLP